MNRPEPDLGEFEVQDNAYLADDVVPDSLIDLLRHLAIDFVPETAAAADCINAWIDEQKELSPGTTALRGVGMATFTVRGVTVNAMAQPYRFYLLARVQDEYAALEADDQAIVEELLASCNMRELLDMKLTRSIGRENNLEVWM